jgi:hypothetical protein
MIAKQSTLTLQESFYLKNYHKLVNQISSKLYVGGKSTWTSGCELNNGLLFSKKLLRPAIYDEKDIIQSTDFPFPFQ